MTQEISGPVNLMAELLPQSDSIVSRPLLKTPAGNLTAFAFDKGQELSTHSTPHDAAIYVVEGSFMIGIGEETHTVAAGEVIHLPASIPHGLAALESSRMLLVMFRVPAE